MNNKFNNHIAIDTQAYNFFIQASEIGYDPDNDSLATSKELADERRAMYHIFEYTDLFIPPTVTKEYQNINDKELLEKRKRWHLIHFRDIVNLDPYEIKKAKDRFIVKHKHENDCYALAESEVGGMNYFVTFDLDLKKRLRNITKLKLFTPSELISYIKTLNIEKIRKPDFGNPLKNENWRKYP